MTTPCGTYTTTITSMVLVVLGKLLWAIGVRRCVGGSFLSKCLWAALFDAILWPGHGPCVGHYLQAIYGSCLCFFYDPGLGLIYGTVCTGGICNLFLIWLLITH